MPANPIVPAGYDVVWIVVAAVQLVLLVVSVAIVWRERGKLDGVTTAIWVVVAVVLPVVFLAAWGIARLSGRRKHAISS
ncbi:hypothetical protein E4U02_11015 [Microbacterium paludicola]|uniref:Cardiolipin synthase N-terminal domain-containing protein n=1 Tax=Microbacterium paludicola TaxID=300019 RepID=A0A4Y9FT27_9MICO|nr:hypothetical protein [Microbacterium paludicola]MBF0816943.1 hypothetical protein [Microbacterium paludicola]TFU32387.1 hypothetical protein E4U02_11015 [Microbacterium paludicola]